MNWTEEIMEKAERIYMRERPRGYPIRGVLNELMTFAVETLAAQDGTLSPEDLTYALDELDASTDIYSGGMEEYREEDSRHIADLRQHVAAQGARMATLQAKYNLIVEELQAAGPLAREVMALRAKVAEVEAERYIDAVLAEDFSWQLIEVGCHRAALAEQGLADARAEVERLKTELTNVSRDYGLATQVRDDAESRLAAILETKFKCAHGHPVDVAGMFPSE